MDGIGIWLLVLVLLPFLLFFIRVIMMTWKNILLAKRLKSVANARQNQVTTISATVDANSTTVSDPPSTSQTEAQIKTDLPPTYDEVMKHYLEAKEAAANSSQNNETSPPDATEVGTCQIDIDDSPPPRYNSV